MTKTEAQPRSEGHLTVRLFAGLRDLFGWNESQVGVDQVSDVTGLLRTICVTDAQRRAVLDTSGEIASGVIVLLNGHHVALKGGVTADLVDGDKVAIFPPVGGG